MDPVQFSLSDRTIRVVVNGFPRRQADGTTKQLRLRMSTGLTISPDQWDDRSGRPSPRWNVTDKHQLDQKLTRIWSQMTSAWEQAREEGQHHPDRVRELYEQIAGIRTAPVAPVDARVVDIVEEIIAKTENEGTKEHYRTFLAKMESFCPRMRISAINDAWRDRFYSYCKQEHGLNDNSMWGLAQKPLNKLINTARKKGMKVNIETDHRFVMQTPQTDWLDWTDLARIANHTPTHKLERSRKRTEDTITLLLTMAYTSCRVSDVWSCLSTIAVRGDVRCAMFQTKKKCGRSNPLVMPIIFLPLWNRIKEHGIPEKRTDQQINQAIKDLLKEVGITKDISCHDLRRSAITNLVSLGCFSEVLISRIFSGHQLRGEMRTFAGYDQADISAKQRVFLRILSGIDKKETGGVSLI